MLYTLLSPWFWRAACRLHSGQPAQRRSFLLLEALFYWLAGSLVCLLVPAARKFTAIIFWGNAAFPLWARVCALALGLAVPCLLAALDWALLRPETHDEAVVCTARRVDALRGLLEARQDALQRQDPLAVQKSEADLRRACAARGMTAQEISALTQPAPRHQGTPSDAKIILPAVLLLLAAAAWMVLLMWAVFSPAA